MSLATEIDAALRDTIAPGHLVALTNQLDVAATTIKDNVLTKACEIAAGYIQAHLRCPDGITPYMLDVGMRIALHRLNHGYSFRGSAEAQDEWNEIVNEIRNFNELNNHNTEQTQTVIVTKKVGGDRPENRLKFPPCA